MPAQNFSLRRALRWAWATYPLWPGTLALLLTVIGLRRPLPPAPSTATGLPALLNTLFTLALWALLVLLGAALGRRILQAFRLPWASPHEALWFALPTGLLALGYPVYALGLAGLFRRDVFAVLFVALVLALGKDIHDAARAIGKGLRAAWANGLELPATRKLLWFWMLFLGGGSFLLALTPPINYDALWYHLQAPRLFFDAGRIYPEWNNWPANYAFAASMLYALPMALGSDIVPKLLHWTFSLTLLGLMYRHVRSQAPSVAWMAPAFMLTMFDFVREMAPSAWVDNATGTLILMAYLGLLQAVRTRKARWLRAAGLWAGLAAGVKVSALSTLAVGVLFWLARGFPKAWRPRLRLALVFLGIALMAMAPWYLKNAFWFGTPLFPAGMRGLDAETHYRVLLNTKYTNLEFDATSNRLLRPLYLLIAPQKLTGISPPPVLSLGLLLFILAVLFLSFPWPDEASLGVLGVLFWALGPSNTRFLMDNFALWGIVCALVAAHAQGLPSPRWGRWIAKIWLYALAILLPFTVFLLGFLLNIRRPWQVIIGRESQNAYLERVLSGYRGLEYMKSHLAPRDRVLLIGDTRHYYCPQQCYPEADHFTWPRWVWAAHANQRALLARLHQKGITHLWLHYGTLHALLAYDPDHQMRQSWTFLQTQFAPSCTEPVYVDQEVALLRITCRAP